VDSYSVWIRDHAGCANDVTEVVHVVVVHNTEPRVAHEGSVECSLPRLIGMPAWPSPQSTHEDLCGPLQHGVSNV
jgi:hypothetical protein